MVRNRKSKRGAKAPQSTGNNAAQGSFGESSSNVGFVIRSIPLFPYRTRRNLQYYFTGSVACGVSTNAAYVISANGAFDPDITGTGGQPMGFDQMMTFYNHYTVLRSRISVLFFNLSSTVFPTVALSVSGSSTVTSSVEQLVENGDLAMHWIGVTGTRGGDVKLSRAVDVAKFQGIDDIMDDPNMRGDSASNPAEQVYYHLNNFNSQGTAAVTVAFQGLIQYDTMFHEPRKGSLSQTRPLAKTEERKTASMSSPTDCATTSGMKWVMVPDT